MHIRCVGRRDQDRAVLANRRNRFRFQASRRIGLDVFNLGEPSNGSSKFSNQTGTITELERTSKSAQEYSSSTPFCVGRGARDRCFEPIFSGGRGANPAVDFGGDKIHHRFSHEPPTAAGST